MVELFPPVYSATRLLAFCLILFALVVQRTTCSARSIERSDFSISATELTFDDLPTMTILSKLYADRGIVFINGVIHAGSYAVSNPNVLDSHDERPLEIDFPRGAARFGIQIDPDGFANRQPVVRAYDSSGVLLGEVSFGQGPDFVGVEFDTPISRIVIGAIASGGFYYTDSFDNLVFELVDDAEPSGELVRSHPNAEWYGHRLAVVHDLDQDTSDDLVIGAPFSDASGLHDSGLAYVFSGASRRIFLTLESPNPVEGGHFGESVAAIEDQTGDGVDDVLVGAPLEQVTIRSRAGRVYVFSGATGTLFRTIESPTPRDNEHFGRSLVALGDWNNDGISDFAVSDVTIATRVRGRVRIFSGATGGVLQTYTAPATLFAGSWGYALARVPDVDGDGYDELLIGMQNEAPFISLISSASGTLLRSFGQAGGGFQIYGAALAGLNDIDNDGRGDVAVSNWGAVAGGRIQAGAVYVYSGGTGNLLYTLNSPHALEYGHFGCSLARVPDVNGDGKDDLLAGAFNEDAPGSPRAGRAYIFSGVDGALIQEYASPCSEANGRFGYSVAGITDLNGDSRGDLAVAALRETPLSGTSKGGRVYIMNGMQEQSLQNAEVAESVIPETLVPGQEIEAAVTMRNTGTLPWSNTGGYKLALLLDTGSLWAYPTARVDMPLDVVVYPGETIVFPIRLAALDNPGSYLLKLQMIQEFSTFFGEILDVVVQISSPSGISERSWAIYQ